MADWKEQLEQIKKLRIERQKNDDELYSAQIRLRKSKNLLQKIKKEETQLPSDPKTIKELKDNLDNLKTELQQLDNEVSKLKSISGKLLLNENRISFLTKKIESLNAQLLELQDNLSEALHQQPPDEKLINKLKEQIERVKKLIDELEEELSEVQREHSLLKQQQRIAEERIREIEVQKIRLKERINTLTERFNEALTPERRDPQEEEVKRRGLEEEYEKAKKKLKETRSKLHEAITGLYIDPHPRRLVPNLNDNIPFLLIPVRIETRFVNTQQSDELWVRVYPDDIAVHTHEKILTDKEVSEGEKYWIALFQADKKGGPDLEKNKNAAWSYLTRLFSSQRAAWIAQSTKPLNWGEAGINKPEELNFPKHDLTKTESWSRAPRTQFMPDRFVVMLYSGNEIVKEVIGNVIPDELDLGPDPLEEEDAFKEKDGKLQFGDSYNWTSDFTKAVESGMGFKIPVSREQPANGFNKVLVLGLYLSSDEEESKTALEILIDNHHYSPKGFSLIKQGAPTNNTDDNGSGYTKNDLFSEISFYVETGKPLFTEADDCDGKNLADALGIEYTALQYVMNSDGKDFREASAMNTALYPATLGFYFDTMFPVLSESNQDKLRDFVIKNVTGRGSIPAIRVGNQPYGILLTSDFSNWKWSDNEKIFGFSFLNGLYNVLQKYHSIWLDLLSQADFIGKPSSEKDPSATLMNILGLQAGSVSFFQRTAYSTDYLSSLDEFQYGGKYFNDVAKNFNSKSNVLNFLSTLGYEGNVPQLLRLVYQHYHTLLDAANLIDNVPLSENDGIRYYDPEAKKNYLHWLAEANSIPILEAQNFEGKPVPNALLYLNLRRALLLQLNKSSVRWLDKNNVDLKDTLKPANFYNILVQPTPAKWEILKAKIEIAKPEHELKNMMVSEYLLSFGRDEEEAEFLNQMKQALKDLTDVPTARLERCFTEHIDTCTYRLDAWQNGLFNVRLKSQRSQIIEGNETRKKGIYLGAFGWVENLKPSARRIANENVPEKLRPSDRSPLYEYDDNNGFIHAPSLNQATAAAVLRSGYVSYAKSDKPEMMAVNLSSERVRRAMFILQGIRNGQRLEALMGYQFERGLHDAASVDENVIKLNEYIYDFRDKFPLELHYIQQQGTGLLTEAIPVNNVVNGLKLSEAAGDTPYGASGNVTSATEAEKIIIRREKDKLSDTLDAVKDLLLSESVYQLVQGNFDRSGAVINALKDANVPPEIDVIQTPRGSQLSFTNRVTIQFEPGAAGNPWTPIPMTTRALMEPGINKWLAEVLGDADKLFFRTAHLDNNGNELGSEELSVDILNLQPIDLIYITGDELNTGVKKTGEENKTGASELEYRIAYYYRTLKGLDNTVPVRIEFLKPAAKKTLGKFLPLIRMLRSVITDSRPLHAQDFDPPSKESMEEESNPKGYNTLELENRIQQQLLSYQNIHNSLLGLSIDAIVKDEDGNEQHYFTLETTFDALTAVKQDFSDITYVFGNTESGLLKNNLLSVSLTGLAGSFPKTHVHTTDQDKLILLQQALIISQRMKENINSSTALLTESTSVTDPEKKIEKLIAAGKALLGDAFNILPGFNYNNEADILLSNTNRTQLLKHAVNELKMDYPVDEWLQNAAHVRPKLSRWDYILSLYECYNGERLPLMPVQLPYRVSDSWLAVEFPDKDPDDPTQSFTIEHDTLSVTVHGNSAFTPASLHCGLLIDDWTEMIPLKNEITGISFHYNQPNASPPQALLLAVPPQVKDNWTWDELVNILNDTLLRAKLRSVEPDMLDKSDKSEVGVLLPAILSDFSQYDLNVALDYRMNLQYVYENNPIIAIQSVK